MADPDGSIFSCNLDAVERTAGRLKIVLDDLHNPPKRHSASDEALASNKITEALRDFSDSSSQQRDKIVASVDALAALLQGLADGVRTVDRALSGSLPDVFDQRPGPGAPQPPPADAETVASGQGRQA